jgi:hypothetical protein
MRPAVQGEALDRDAPRATLTGDVIEILRRRTIDGEA